MQAGIIAAADGDTVLVASDSYLERIDFLGKSIVVMSESGPASTIIDGGSEGTVVTFANGETGASVLAGFTITGGWSQEPGGGIRCIVSSPTIEGNIITQNRAVKGGGIYCVFSQPVIRDNMISDNLSVGFLAGGGGIQCEGSAAPTISGNEIVRNRAQGFLSGGGGIWSGDSSPTITGNLIAGNEALDDAGGGVFCAFSPSSPYIEGNTIVDNRAGDAGGVNCVSTSTVMLGNIVARNEGNVSGGVRTVGSGTTELTANTIYGNVARLGTGGAVWVDAHEAALSQNILAHTVGGEALICSRGATATLQTSLGTSWATSCAA